MVKLTSHTTIRITLSHEEVQNMARMNEAEGNAHLEEFYGIDSSRIIEAQVSSEATKSPILTLKIKQK